VIVDFSCEHEPKRRTHTAKHTVHALVILITAWQLSLRKTIRVLFSFRQSVHLARRARYTSFLRKSAGFEIH